MASGKLVTLKEILNNLGFNEDDSQTLLQNENKLLIFSQSNSTLDLIKRFIHKIFRGL